MRTMILCEFLSEAQKWGIRACVCFERMQ